MIRKTPEGYRKLLAYNKAVEVQQLTEHLVSQFPKTKTFVALADQMSRSARSSTKNIVEGWKRNTTKEYLQFLGYSIGSNSELMEDAVDVATGLYEGLKGIRGVIGEKGERGGGERGGGERGALAREELDALRFYPLDSGLPPAVQLFLKSKEVNFLLYRLQQSLDYKMDQEGTKPLNMRVREQMQEDKQAERAMDELINISGLIQLKDGRYVKRGDHDH